MTPTVLYIVIGLITLLIVLPLVITVLVRILIKDEPEEALAEPEPATEFQSIGDFWQGMAPHLFELRDRLVKALLAVGIGTSIGFYVVNSPAILGKSLPVFLVDALAPGTRLQGIGVGEVFVSYMRIALVVGVALAMPVIIYQLVAFFSPGLLRTRSASSSPRCRSSPSCSSPGWPSAGSSPCRPP
jgi:sec-independent protein translocase protein TatC